MLMEKLEVIQECKLLYNICFRKAGVGLQFVNLKKPKVRPFYDLEKVNANDNRVEKVLPDNWKDFLEVDKYYPTLEEAIDAEYERREVDRCIVPDEKYKEE